MKTLTATEVRKKLLHLLNEVVETHEPVKITGNRSNAVLISEEDYRSIMETLYLSSIPGLQESIKKGMNTPLKTTDKKLEW